MSKRPRPRPKRVATASQTTHTLATQSSLDASSDAGLPPSSAVDENEFIVNRARTWEEIDRKSKRYEEAQRQSSPPTEDDDDEDPAKGRRALRSPGKRGINLPSWTNPKSKQEKLEAVNVDESDHDSDSTTTSSVVEVDHTPRAGSNRNKAKHMSRERSLTPPPLLDIGEIDRARLIIQQELKLLPRRRSSPDISNQVNVDDEDEEVLHPALQKIRDAARQRDGTKGKGRESADRFASAEVEDPKTKTEFSMKWIPDPDAEEAVIIPDGVLRCSVGRKETFHHLFHYLSQICQVPSDDLVVTHDNTRIFPGATPESLKMWRTASLVASDLKTYHYLRGRGSQQPELSSRYPVNGDYGRSPSVLSESGDNEKIRLTFRSSTNETSLKVKASTTCREAIELFIRKVELTGNTGKGKIVVDGDKMDDDATIADLDLEDGDMVEVVGV